MKNSGLKLKDIIFIALISLIFGVVYLIAVYAGQALSVLLTPSGYGFLAWDALFGIWLMAATLATYIIRKPGVGFIAEMLAAIIEMLLGSFYGAAILMAGFVQGAGCELAFTATRYKKYNTYVMIFAAILAAIFSALWNAWRGGYAALEPQALILSLSVKVISAIIFCGIINKLIADKMNKAGVLKSYAIAADLEK